MDENYEPVRYKNKWAFDKSNRRSSRLWRALNHACWKYIDNTQVHGFFHLRADESKGLKRIFWSIVIILSFLFGAVILLQLIAKFFGAPFLITQGRNEMLMRIPFPSISICHSQTVIDYHSRIFVNKIIIPDGITRDDVVKMLPMALGSFTENQWGPVDTNYLSTINEILDVNGLSVLDAVKSVGINCTELVVRCSFNKKRFPCVQDDEHFTFRQTMTHIGLCCSFNYNPTNLSYVPLKVNSYGVRGGLSIIATSFPHTNDGTSGLLFSDGYILFMHPPLDFPTTGSSMALLEVGKITSIGIYPTIVTASNDVTTLPLQSRKCLVGSDIGLKNYRRAACATNCLAQFIYDKCECHPYFLPAMDSDRQIRNCVVLDGECIQRNYYDMKKIRCTSCLPACEDVLYSMSSAEIAYSFANTSINPMYDQTNVTTNEFTAHIYFAGSTVPVQRTFMVVSFIELLSNFGGVFSLVLGISIFSILELVYYFCIQLFHDIGKPERVIPMIVTIQSTNKIN